jgi:hypothetical protein
MEAWFLAEIEKGVRVMAELRPYNSPQPEDDEAMAHQVRLWVNTLWRDRQWVEARDKKLIQDAFLELRKTQTRWPQPSHLLGMLRQLNAQAQNKAALLPSGPRLSPEEQARERKRSAAAWADFRRWRNGEITKEQFMANRQADRQQGRG